MPKRTDKPARKPRWRVDLMHGKRAEHLGEVEADTEEEALAEACREWASRPTGRSAASLCGGSQIRAC
jgi:hypothetical protein